jgi:hypothetical protein
MRFRVRHIVIPVAFNSIHVQSLIRGSPNNMCNGVEILSATTSLTQFQTNERSVFPHSGRYHVYGTYLYHFSEWQGAARRRGVWKVCDDPLTGSHNQNLSTRIQDSTILHKTGIRMMMISMKHIFSLVVLVSPLDASSATRLKGSRRGGGGGDADAGRRALKSSKTRRGAKDYDGLTDLLVSGSCFYLDVDGGPGAGFGGMCTHVGGWPVVMYQCKNVLRYCCPQDTLNYDELAANCDLINDGPASCKDEHISGMGLYQQYDPVDGDFSICCGEGLPAEAEEEFCGLLKGLFDYGHTSIEQQNTPPRSRTL